jgi:transcription initiation factor TFIIIB Brf1 subunit/transcription initiation factor TFIIB
VEHNGLLVCEGCGLVLAPVYEPPKFKPADSSFNFFNGFNGAPHIVNDLARRVLKALAGELGVPAGAVLEVYKRLRRYAGVGEAAAIALFVTAKRSGTYISLKRACELLSKCGVKAEYPRTLKTMLAYAPLIRPTMEEALEAYAAKLGIGESAKREALAILAKVKPYAGGRDPYLVALAAIYLSSGTFSIYGLARLVGRSPSRLHDTVRFLSSLLRGGGK